MENKSLRPKLPKDFIIGTATASYQVEGAGFEDGRTSCIWDDFAKVPGAVYKGQNAEVSVDQYHRYKEDVALMASLGIQVYRFSVSWSRIFPHGGTEINPKGIEYYKNLCKELHSYGIKTCCTIYHWDLPSEIQTEGGWAVRSTAYKLAQFAAAVFKELGNLVDMWITINEFACVTYVSYLEGCQAPGIKDYQKFINSVHYLNLAHGLIVQEYRKTGLKAPIGTAHNIDGSRPASDNPKDILANKHRVEIRNEIYLGPQFKGKYPSYVIDELKWNLPIQEGDMAIINEKTDFLGVNYYNENVISWSDTDYFNFKFVTPKADSFTAMGWSIDPEGLVKLLTWASDYVGKDFPIYITENGAAFEDKLEKDGSVHDNQRIEYIYKHLKACEKAIEKGINLKGYFCWSYIDNYEWVFGFVPRFGIVYCDYETLKRYPKDSAYYLKDIITGLKV